jgi:hypothetical protein
LKVTFGWQSIFLATGALGLVWAVVFRRTYRDPAEFPGVNSAEIAQIRAEGGIPDLSERIAARRRRGRRRYGGISPWCWAGASCGGSTLAITHGE